MIACSVVAIHVTIVLSLVVFCLGCPEAWLGVVDSRFAYVSAGTAIYVGQRVLAGHAVVVVSKFLGCIDVGFRSALSGEVGLAVEARANSLVLTKTIVHAKVTVFILGFWQVILTFEDKVSR